MRDVQLVQLTGVGFDLYVRSEDWLKIAPFLVDGTMNPGVGAPAVLFSDLPIDVSTIDLQDQDLYRRVYGTLQSIFTKTYPTSNI